MKRKIWVAAMTATMLVGLATTASAQERQRNRRGNAEQAAPATPPVSREFATAFGPLQTALGARDWATADTALAAARAAAANPYEQYLVARADLMIGSGQQNQARQAAAADAIMASNGVPDTEKAQIYVITAQLAYNARNFAAAAERAALAAAAGASNEQLPLLRMSALFEAGNADGAIAYFRELESAAAAHGQHAPDAIYGMVGRNLQELDRTSDLLPVLIDRASFYPDESNMRAAILTVLQSAPDDTSLSMDMLRLMHAAGAMNNRRFYVEQISNLAEAGLPNEALMMIQAGRTANLIPANDPTFTEVETTQRSKLADDRASLPAGERRAAAAADGRLARLMGDAYYSYGDYPKAEAMYAMALTKSPADADLLNMRIAIVRFAAGNSDGALQALALVTGPVRGNAARLWAGFIRSRQAAAAPATTPAPAAPTTGN